MHHRRLGSSGLLVSPVCLGTMTFGSPVAERDAITLVHTAIDRGINFIDTANVYEGYDRVLGSAGGVAEEIVGKALADRRDRVVLATKVGAPVGHGPNDRGLSKAHILREVDASLRRLKTDVIDLYIVHWPDNETPLETTLAAMDVALRQGKIRSFGASNHSAAKLCELQYLARIHSWPTVVSSQVPFSMLRRELTEDLVFCEEKSIGVTPYQPLQGGLLTGKYRRGESPPVDSRAAEKPAWIWPRDDALFDTLEQVAKLAAEVDVNMARYALAWTLTQPGMSSLVVGVKRAEQIEDAVAAVDVEIPTEHLPQIDQLCPPPWKFPDPIRGPQVMPVGK